LIRPENERLDEDQKRRVLEKVREQGFACGSCGSTDFTVGDALYVGFLFLDEEVGNYMVALNCKNPDCARTGIRLHQSEFLSTDGR
jgi:hypothetical protein